MNLKHTLNRVFYFSAAHRLHTSLLSDEANRDVYDKCNNPSGHGHDYKLEVSLIGSPHPDTGMIISLDEFDSKVNSVIARINYKHLDIEVDFFKKRVSTGEIIINYLWQELDEILPKGMLHHLILWETNNNYFELGR